ncbi:MAG: PilX N-terminal domain-containing pilus assembly protein [Pseudomonadota bacterium]
MNGQPVTDRGQRGAALVACLMVMAIISLLAASMITNAVIELRAGGSQRQAKVSFYAADGATQMIAARLSVADPAEVAANGFDPITRDMGTALPGDWLVDPSGAWVNQAQVGTFPSYNYRVRYLGKSNPPKGYSAIHYAGYYYQVDCNTNDGAGIGTICMKIGPK